MHVALISKLFITRVLSITSYNDFNLKCEPFLSSEHRPGGRGSVSLVRRPDRADLATKNFFSNGFSAASWGASRSSEPDLWKSVLVPILIAAAGC